MIIHLVFTFFALIFTTDCWAIINGKNASPSDYPNTIQIRDSSDDRHLCTGTAIGPDLVLTDAHCMVSNGAPFLIQNGVYIPIEHKNISYPEDFLVPATTRIERRPPYFLQKVYRECPEDYEWDSSFRKCSKKELDVAVIRVNSFFSSYAKFSKEAPLAGDCVQLLGFGMNSIGEDMGGETTVVGNHLQTIDPILRTGMNSISKILDSTFQISGPSIQIRKNIFIQDFSETSEAVNEARRLSNFTSDQTMVSFGDSGGAVFNQSKEIVGLVASIQGSNFADQVTQLDAKYPDVKFVSTFTANLLRTDTKEFQILLRKLLAKIGTKLESR